MTKIEERNITEYRELEAFLRDKNTELRELATTTDGMASIPEWVAESIVTKATEKSPIVNHVKLFQTANGGLKIPAETENSSGAFFGEGESVAAQNFQLSHVTLSKKRLAAAISMTKNIVFDAKVDLIDFVADKLARQISDKLEESIFVGTGNETSVHGILNNTEIASVSGTGEPTVEEIANVINSLKAKYTQNAAFYVSSEYYDKLSKWVDSSGQPMMETLVIDGKVYRALFGYPVHSTSSLTVSNPVVFGNPGDAYGLLVDTRSTIKRVVNSTAEALQGSELIIGDFYVDGDVYNPEAICKLTVA